MPQPTLAMNATDPQKILTAQIIDVDGNPITGLSGYQFVFGFNDSGQLVTPQGPLSTNTGTIPILPTGRAGSVGISVQATKNGAATQTGSATLNITGPAPAGVLLYLA